jgi:hypothetical protein
LAILINLPVQRLEKVLRLQEIRNSVESVIIDQHSAKQRLLGLDIVRRRAVKRLIGLNFPQRFGHDSSCLFEAPQLARRPESFNGR